MILPKFTFTVSSKLDSVPIKDGQIIFVKDNKLMYVDMDTTRIDIGAKGPKGDTGPAGPTGPKGNSATVTVGKVTTGAAGSQASVVNSGTLTDAKFDFTIPKGDKGDAGPKGDIGPKGDRGEQGAAATVTVGTVTTGAAGSQASVVNSGSSNSAKFDFTIPKGDKGDTGPQGQVGPTGPAGATGPVGPQGPKGETGPSGPAGAAATVKVGKVITTEAGTSATVKNSGTESAAVLDFTIPKGAIGPQGPTGAVGPTGPTGPKGDRGIAATIKVGTVTTGAAGSKATVTNSGTTSDATLNFTIPKGDTGATGPQGAVGPKGDTGNQGPKGDTGLAATIKVGTVTTGAAGSKAAVTNIGTSTAAVLNFTIPKGDKGDTPDTFNNLTVSTLNANKISVSNNITCTGYLSTKDWIEILPHRFLEHDGAEYDVSILQGYYKLGGNNRYYYGNYQISLENFYSYNDGYIAGTLYTSSGSVSRSDRNEKNSIELLDKNKCSDFIYSLKPSKFKYNDGSSGRYHHGLISQEVKESMGNDDWGVYCDITIPGEYEQVNGEIITIKEERKSSSIRYEELIADLIATVQSQNERIKILEDIIKKNT